MFLIYRITTIIFYPFFILIIYFRKLVQKESGKSCIEKLFSYSNKPLVKNKKVVWFHGASIGEIQSVIPIINYLIKTNKNIKILLTSTTLSSEKIIHSEFGKNKNVHHQYFPLDVPFLIKKFLNSWRPSIAIFIDSEIWPNFIFNIKKNKIPLILINGRITKKSFNRWRLFSGLAKNVFSSFNLCFASSKNSHKNLKVLGAKNIKYFGNLKFITSLAKTNKATNLSKNYYNKHKVWCAASTHKNEEIFCFEVHKKLKKTYNKILTIIVPRHIHRVEEIFEQATKLNLKTQIIKHGESINKGMEIVLINSFGVLNYYYDYCKSIFIGKSLEKKLISVSGQNPLEAARAGCKIYHGPYVYNFHEIYEFLSKINITKKINNTDELAARLIQDFRTVKNINAKNIKKINIYGENILKKTTKEIIKLI